MMAAIILPSVASMVLLLDKISAERVRRTQVVRAEVDFRVLRTSPFGRRTDWRLTGSTGACARPRVSRLASRRPVTRRSSAHPGRWLRADGRGARILPCRVLAELRQGSETEPVSLERTRCTVSTRGRIRERVGESRARHSDGVVA